MSFYTQLICRDCERSHFCDHPCMQFSDEKMALDIEKKQQDLKEAFYRIDGRVEVIKMDEDEVLDEFMYNFIESSVDQPEYLQVCNGLVHPSKILDWEILLDYMKEKNKIFSDDNGICEVCHSPFVEKKEYEEIWGSRQVSEILWVCPHGC